MKLQPLYQEQSCCEKLLVFLIEQPLLSQLDYEQYLYEEKSKFRDKDEWIVKENIHEALVEKDLFEKVRRFKEKNQGSLPYHSLKNTIKDGKENVGLKIQRDKSKEGKER